VIVDIDAGVIAKRVPRGDSWERAALDVKENERPTWASGDADKRNSDGERINRNDTRARIRTDAGVE
jgi:hypothetical protein